MADHIIKCGGYIWNFAEMTCVDVEDKDYFYNLKAGPDGELMCSFKDEDTWSEVSGGYIDALKLWKKFYDYWHKEVDAIILGESESICYEWDILDKPDPFQKSEWKL